MTESEKKLTGLIEAQNKLIEYLQSKYDKQDAKIQYLYNVMRLSPQFYHNYVNPFEMNS
jgi:hypothetical protein